MIASKCHKKGYEVVRSILPIPSWETTEGNHRLWVAIQEGIPFIPCRVIPHWLPLNDSYKKLEMDFSTLKFGETILPAQLGLTVAQIGFNK